MGIVTSLCIYIPAQCLEMLRRVFPVYALKRRVFSFCSLSTAIR